MRRLIFDVYSKARKIAIRPHPLATMSANCVETKVIPDVLPSGFQRGLEYRIDFCFRGGTVYLGCHHPTNRLLITVRDLRLETTTVERH